MYQVIHKTDLPDFEDTILGEYKNEGVAQSRKEEFMTDYMKENNVTNSIVIKEA